MRSNCEDLYILLGGDLVFYELKLPETKQKNISKIGRDELLIDRSIVYIYVIFRAGSKSKRYTNPR